MLKVEHLKKTYPKSDRVAVDDISFELRPGEIFGFLGQNGAGKSTTIKCLTGILPFDSGTITICGHDIVKEPIKAKMEMGYVPDNHSVYERLTGREYVNYVADLYKVPALVRTERIDRYAKLFKLENAIDRQIKSYSHGMKQKICIIAALIHDPKLWVLDEPMMGLDPQSTAEIISYMREHCAKATRFSSRATTSTLSRNFATEPQSSTTVISSTSSTLPATTKTRRTSKKLSSASPARTSKDCSRTISRKRARICVPICLLKPTLRKKSFARRNQNDKKRFFHAKRKDAFQTRP